jgi:hypothetical protein
VSRRSGRGNVLIAVQFHKHRALDVPLKERILRGKPGDPRENNH